MGAMASELKSAVGGERSKLKGRKNILMNFLCITAVGALCFLLLQFVFGVALVAGGSMGDTLEERSVVLYFRPGVPTNGDIVVASFGDKLLVKRVIASGGQTVEILEGMVLVDGIVLDEPYLTDETTAARDVTGAFTVPDGQFFLMGDHRSVSVDSRNGQVGCFDASQLEGTFLLRLK